MLYLKAFGKTILAFAALIAVMLFLDWYKESYETLFVGTMIAGFFGVVFWLFVDNAKMKIERDERERQYEQRQRELA